MFIGAVKNGNISFSYTFYLFKHLYDSNYKQFVYSLSY